MNGGFFEIGDKQLEWRRWGDGSPTIVLLHDGLGCVELWRELPEQLCGATGCAVFAYSRYGVRPINAISRTSLARYMHDEALAVLPEVLAAQD